jgi:hypothetical protein
MRLTSILENQILITKDKAQIMSNTIAVALTLALPRLLVFIKLLLPPCTKIFSRCCQVVSTRLTSFPRRLSRGEGGNIALSGLNPRSVYPPRTPHQPAYILDSSSRIASGLTCTLQDSSFFEDGGAWIFRRHLAQPPLQVGEMDIGFWEGASLSSGISKKTNGGLF